MDLETDRGPIRGIFPRAFAKWTRRRALITLTAGGMGAAVGYAVSWIVKLATCPNGGCPTASEPVPFIALLALVAAWSASSGARQ